MFETFEKIKELAKKRGKALGQVEEDLGYGRNTLYKIKILRQTLNVSQKLLIISTYPPTTCSDEQITLLSLGVMNLPK